MNDREVRVSHVRIPWDALDCAETTQERGAVALLFIHSDHLRHRPFACAVRYLQQLWCMDSRKQSEALLARLVEAGQVAIETAGDRTRSRRVRVNSGGHLRGHLRGHVGGHLGGHVDPPSEQAQDVNGNTPGDTSGDTSGDTPGDKYTNPNLQPQPTTPDDSLSGKPDEVSPARQVWLHWKQYHPRARKLREADARKIRGRLAEDDLETCLLVADWVHLAPDAAYFRGENDQQTVYTGCATLYKADKWSQRVDRAQRWDEQGRPDTSTPSKPSPVPPPVTSMGRWEEERRLKREAYEREQAELMERIRETAKHDPEYAKMMGLA
jgi:hypothetical protein